MALISGEITVKGEKYRLKDYRSPKSGEHYLHDGRVYQSLSDFGTVEFLIVEPAPKPWRVPTDEDAVKRPKCRVRDHVDSDWLERVLIAVLDSEDGGVIFRFVATEKDMVQCWAYCEIQD